MALDVDLLNAPSFTCCRATTSLSYIWFWKPIIFYILYTKSSIQIAGHPRTYFARTSEIKVSWRRWGQVHLDKHKQVSSGFWFTLASWESEKSEKILLLDQEYRGFFLGDTQTWLGLFWGLGLISSFIFCVCRSPRIVVLSQYAHVCMNIRWWKEGRGWSTLTPKC